MNLTEFIYGRKDIFFIFVTYIIIKVYTLEDVCSGRLVDDEEHIPFNRHFGYKPLGGVLHKSAGNLSGPVA